MWNNTVNVRISFVHDKLLSTGARHVQFYMELDHEHTERFYMKYFYVL